MVSGFFLGGAAEGFNQGEQQIYQQGILKLAQQRQQAAEKQQAIENFWNQYNQFIKVTGDTINAHKEQLSYDHPDMPADSVSRTVTNGLMPGIGHTMDQLTNMAGILGIQGVDVKAQVSNMFSMPSPTTTMRAEAAAKEPPGSAEERRARAGLYGAETRQLGPAPQPGGPMTMGGNSNDTSQNFGDRFAGAAAAGGISDTAKFDVTQTPEGKGYLDALSKNSGMGLEALDAAGRGWAAGDPTATQNVGRGRQGPNQLSAIKAWGSYVLMHEQGLSAADAANAHINNVIQFRAKAAGATSGARTAGSRAANLGVIESAADSAIGPAITASEAVPRGNWVRMNSAIQAGKTEFSDPAMKVFAQKNLQLAELWAKSFNPTGALRNEDRQLALSILSTATGPEAYKAAAQAIRQSIGVEKNAAKKFLRDAGYSSALDENPDALSGGGQSDVSPGWKFLGAEPAR